MRDYLPLMERSKVSYVRSGHAFPGCISDKVSINRTCDLQQEVNLTRSREGTVAAVVGEFTPNSACQSLKLDRSKESHLYKLFTLMPTFRYFQNTFTTSVQ